MKTACRPAALALLCALAPTFALAQSPVDPGGETTFASEKSQLVGGVLEFSGAASWSGSQANGTITFAFDRLTNKSTTHTSGTVRAMIVLTVEPDGGPTFSYFPLGGWQFTNQLLPQQFFDDFSQTVPMLPLPPPGIYYVQLAAFEYEPGYGCFENYCIDHYGTFPTRVQVADGVISNYNPTTLAVEYFNASFGHYFVTADSGEIAGLDGGAYNFAFQRTGQQWKVWTSGSAFDLCRFFTTPGTFGAKSSHFYTAILAECNGLKFNPNWIYEKIEGKVLLPTGGVCPAGTQILYRLYNAGQTGAPNHRYTISPVIRTQMIQQGFVPEDPNNACVPL